MSQIGRPYIEYPIDFVEKYSEWKAGGISAVTAMIMMGISKSTFYRMVKEYEREGGLRPAPMPKEEKKIDRDAYRKAIVASLNQTSVEKLKRIAQQNGIDVEQRSLEQIIEELTDAVVKRKFPEEAGK